MTTKTIPFPNEAEEKRTVQSFEAAYKVIRRGILRKRCCVTESGRANRLVRDRHVEESPVDAVHGSTKIFQAEIQD